MLKELINLANSLDERGFKKEADDLDKIVTKLAMNWDDEDWGEPTPEPTPEELDKIREEEDEIAKEAEKVSAEEILAATMDFIQNPSVPREKRELLKEKIIGTIGNDLMMMGGFGLGGRMELGGLGISPTGPMVAEAKSKSKKKPSKKQLDALDKNKNGKIDSEDFELLRKKKTKKKK